MVETTCAQPIAKMLSRGVPSDEILWLHVFLAKMGLKNEAPAHRFHPGAPNGDNIVSLHSSREDENRPRPGNRTEKKKAGLLGPTESRLGPNLADLGLKLGRTGAHLSPTWA